MSADSVAVIPSNVNLFFLDFRAHHRAGSWHRAAGYHLPQSGGRSAEAEVAATISGSKWRSGSRLTGLGAVLRSAGGHIHSRASRTQCCFQRASSFRVGSSRLQPFGVTRMRLGRPANRINSKSKLLHLWCAHDREAIGLHRGVQPRRRRIVGHAILMLSGAGIVIARDLSLANGCPRGSGRQIITNNVALPLRKREGRTNGESDPIRSDGSCRGKERRAPRAASARS